MNDKDKSIIESLDDWYFYDEIVTERPVYNDGNFWIVSGEVKNDGGDLLFRALLFDRETKDVYRICFNSTWCPADHKVWLLQVVISEQVEAITEAKRLQRGRTKNSFVDFVSTFNPGYRL